MKSIEHFSLLWLWKKKESFMLGFLLLSVASVFSRTNKVTVTGTVIDSAGVGVPTVTISERGTTNSTATDQGGTFSIKVNGPRSVLVATSVGYAPQEIRVGGQTSLTIRLQQTSQALGEVVVIGYGTQKRGSLTGSIATVTSKDLDRVHAGSTVSSYRAISVKC